MKKFILSIIFLLFSFISVYATDSVNNSTLLQVTLNASTTSTEAYFTADQGWFSFSAEYATGVTGAVALQYRADSSATWKTLTSSTFTGTDTRVFHNVGMRRQFRFIVTTTLSGDVITKISQTPYDKTPLGRP